jgi:hypothetical protein
VAGVLLTAPAFAQPSSPAATVAPLGARAPGGEAEADEASGMRWYGWQPLLVDSVAYGMFFGSDPIQVGDKVNVELLAASVITFSLAAPAVHFANGRIGRGFGSLGLRSGMVVAGAFTGVALGGCHDYYVDGDERDTCADAAKTVLAFMAVATVVDAAALSWKPDEDDAPTRSAGRILPGVAVTRDRVALAVGAAF